MHLTNPSRLSGTPGEFPEEIAEAIAKEVAVRSGWGEGVGRRHGGLHREPWRRRRRSFSSGPGTCRLTSPALHGSVHFRVVVCDERAEYANRVAVPRCG